MLEHASVMRRYRSYNVGGGGGVTYTYCFRYPHRKKFIGVKPGEREVHYTKHHTRLFVPQIAPSATDSLVTFCAQACRHVGTIHFEIE